MGEAVKIAVSGKGGVGKTTIAALLCRAMQERGYRVLAVDADPAGGLGSALGLSEEELPIPLSEMKDLIAERTGVRPGSQGTLFTLNPRVDDLPEKISRELGGIRVLAMGTVKKGGGGCLCPEATLLRALVQHLFLQRNEAVIMDMEAGLEHLGRATAEAVDRLLVVVEPGMRSIDTALRIKRLAADIHITRISIAANKIRNDDDRHFIAEAITECDIAVYFPYDERLLQADMKRLPPWKLSPSALDVARAFADTITGQV